MGLGIQRGQVIDRHCIEEYIGHGSSGEVWTARHIYLNRLDAIKVIDTRYLDQQDLRRIEHECQIGGKISYREHLVEVRDAFQRDDRYFIVMEYVSGGDLCGYLYKHPCPDFGMTLAWALDLCTALEQVHAQDVIHRDIKPQNILLTGDLQVKLGDFGVAHLPDSDLTTMHQPGTRAYCSPEQEAGLPAEKGDDVYSLCAVLFEVWTGCRCMSYRHAEQKVIRDEMSLLLKERYPDLEAGLRDRLVNLVLAGLHLRPSRIALVDLQATLRDIQVSWQHESAAASDGPQFARSELGDYVLTPSVVISTLRDLPGACDQNWETAVEHFVRGYLTERMEARLVWLRNQGQYYLVRKLEPTVRSALLLQQEATQGDDFTRNARFEAFLQLVGSIIGGVDAPSIALDRETVDLQVAMDGNTIGAKSTLTITNAGRGYLYGTIRPTVPWLTVTPERFGCLAGIETPIAIEATAVTLNTIPHGTVLTGTIVIESNGDQQRQVVQTRLQANWPVLSIDPVSIDFSEIVNRACERKELRITNVGSSILEGQLDTSEPWLRLVPTEFRCHPGSSVQIELEAQTTALRPGLYQAEVRITSNGGTHSVPARADVKPQPKLVVETERLDFDRATGRKSLTLRNVGVGMLRVHLASPAPWLIVEPDQVYILGEQSAEVKVRVHFGRLDTEIGRTQLPVTANDERKNIDVEAKAKILFPQKSWLGWELVAPNGMTHHARSERRLLELLAMECWINGEVPRRPLTELQPNMCVYGIVKEIGRLGMVIDIGAECDGQLHFERVPFLIRTKVTNHLQPGDSVTVWIGGVNIERRRIELTMIEPAHDKIARMFASELSLNVIGRTRTGYDAEWQALGTTPGNVLIPGGYDFGIESHDADDQQVGRLVQELDDFGPIQLLDMSHSHKITDGGLVHLAVLTNLATLNLEGCTRVTNKGLVHLGTLARLESLNLAGCKITDAGLAYLQALTDLSHLNLRGCKRITEAGLVFLERPGLEIIT